MKRVILGALLALLCGSALAAESTIQITVPGSGTSMLGALATTGANAGAFSTRMNLGDATNPDIGAQVDVNGLHVVIGSTLPAFAATPTFTLGAGSALAGKFGIDQTTPGTTNGVVINSTLPAFAATPTVKIDQTTPGVTNGVSIANAATTSTFATVTVATGGSYTDALTANSARRGCIIQNPVAATEPIKLFIGTTGSSHTVALDISIGGSYSCGFTGGITTENLDVSAATTGHTVTVVSW